MAGRAPIGQGEKAALSRASWLENGVGGGGEGERGQVLGRHWISPLVLAARAQTFSADMPPRLEAGSTDPDSGAGALPRPSVQQAHLLAWLSNDSPAHVPTADGGLIPHSPPSLSLSPPPT